MLEDAQEDAPDVGVEAEQADTPGKAQAQAQEEKVAAESYEKRQMLWKGMAGRSWRSSGACLRSRPSSCRSRLPH